jgi:hypothetical protein
VTNGIDSAIYQIQLNFIRSQTFTGLMQSRVPVQLHLIGFSIPKSFIARPVHGRRHLRRRCQRSVQKRDKSKDTS